MYSLITMFGRINTSGTRLDMDIRSSSVRVERAHSGRAMYFLYFLISAFVSTAFLFVHKRYAYWKERNVPHLAPVFPLGNLNRLTSYNLLEKVSQIYTQFKGTSPIAGVYLFTQPAVVALDLGLIKSILIKDFAMFTDRLQFSNAVLDPLSNHLFNMTGSSWRRMRSKLSPTFTSGKMKFMFPTVSEVAAEFSVSIRHAVEESSVLEIRDLLSRFTSDVIATCVFGIQCDSRNDAHSELCSFGRRVMEEPQKLTLLRLFLVTYKKLAQQLGFKSLEPKDAEFFMKAIEDIVSQREANNVQRNDFMNLLIELKNQKGPDGLDGLTIEEIAAQAFVFFVAGFETSASNMSFTLLELSKQPVLQDKVREEIVHILKKHNNELPYEAMSEMKYLSQCMQETMRKYPALVSLTRIANADYPIPGTKLVIEKGTPVLIPLRVIHHDPEIYADPEKFDPDRFSAVNLRSRDAMAFLGFGDGPRNCIGRRFARMQVRIGLIALLRTFKFSTTEKTPTEVAFNSKSLVLLPSDKLWLKVEAI